MIICEQCEHYYVCADKQTNNGCLGKCPNFKKEQYERPQGEWLFVSRNCWKCPYCQELTNEGKNFCPNCGAYMRGENNG